jgi:hypothetical protein
MSSDGDAPVVFLKIHRRGNEVCAAVCDENVLGKVFRADQGALCLQVKAPFYGGSLTPVPQAVKYLKSCPNFNAAGETITAALVAEGIIPEDGVRRVGGCPFVLRLL